jgi:hypothetical protein
MRYSHLTSSAVKDAMQVLNNNFGHNMATVLNFEEGKAIGLNPGGFKISLKPQ